MGIDPDLVMTFKESIDGFVDARIHACGYFSSHEYDQHLNGSIELDNEIRERLGEEYTEIWDELSGLDEIKGEQLAYLSESCYRRGFNDALLLIGELDRAKGGQQNIFS